MFQCSITDKLTLVLIDGKLEVFFFFRLQDLLLPYFCNTTDITSSRMRVHTDGKWCFPFHNITLNLTHTKWLNCAYWRQEK